MLEDDKMDALDFLKTREDFYKRRWDCMADQIFAEEWWEAVHNNDYGKMIEIMEDYKDYRVVHPPRQTRQDLFIKRYPRAMINDNKLITICPHRIDIDFKCGFFARKEENEFEFCLNCAKKYWLEEVDDKEVNENDL